MDLISLTNEQKEKHQKWKNIFETKYGFQFHEPNYNSVPFVSELMENQRAKTIFENFEYYLIGNYFIDMGTNNSREIRNIKLEWSKENNVEEFNWFKEHNKLNPSRWGYVHGLEPVSLNKLLERDDLIVQPTLLKSSCYSQLTFNEKIDYVKSIDQKLYHLLERIYPEYQ